MCWCRVTSVSVRKWDPSLLFIWVVVLNLTIMLEWYWPPHLISIVDDLWQRRFPDSDSRIFQFDYRRRTNRLNRLGAWFFNQHLIFVVNALLLQDSSVLKFDHPRSFFFDVGSVTIDQRDGLRSNFEWFIIKSEITLY